jgi:hypothetical protein
MLTKRVLARHFSTKCDEGIVGLHTTSPDNTSLWGGFDIDCHDGDGNTPEATAEAAGWLYHELDSRGFRPLLTDSDGRGGYHLRILFSEPVATPALFSFLNKIADDFDKVGMAKRPEVFPKQAQIAPGRFGNWLRVPGRHHTRDHWSRVYTGNGKWFEGNDAVGRILSFTGDDPALVPEVDEAAPEHELPLDRPAEPVPSAEEHAEAPAEAPADARLADGELILKGRRDNTLTSLAGTMRRRGMGEDEILAALRVTNSRRCDPPLDDDQVKKIAGSVAGYPPDPMAGVTIKLSSPSTSGQAAVPKRAPAPFVPFPVEHLPPPLRELVVEGAQALLCDPSQIALPVLAAVGGVIGNTYKVKLKRTWREPAIIWGMVVAESSTMKSPAWQLAIDPIRDLQKVKLDEYEKKHQEYEQNKAAYDQRTKESRRNNKPVLTLPPDEPTAIRFLTMDTTVEKVALMLQENPRGVLLARDELRAWLGSFQRYNAKGGNSDLPNWLEMHRAGTVIIDRKTGIKTTIFVPQASISVTGTIQPGILKRALTHEFFESGLAARCLMAMPPKRKKVWTEAEISVGTEQTYQQLILDLARVPYDSENGPCTLALAPDAKRAWIEFFNEWGSEQAGAEGNRAACFGKIEAYAARLALVHHVVTKAIAKQEVATLIPLESMEAGIALARWFAAEASRIYEFLGESQEATVVRGLVDFITLHGGWVTARQLHRSNKSRYPTVAVAEAALEELVVAGLAEWLVAPAGPKGGRPTRRLYLTTYSTGDETDKTDKTSDDDGDEDPDGNGGVPPKPPTKPPSPGENAPKSEVSSGFGFVPAQYKSSGTPSETPPKDQESPEGFVGQLGVVSVTSRAPDVSDVAEPADPSERGGAHEAPDLVATTDTVGGGNKGGVGDRKKGGGGLNRCPFGCRGANTAMSVSKTSRRTTCAGCCGSVRTPTRGCGRGSVSSWIWTPSATRTTAWTGRGRARGCCRTA